MHNHQINGQLAIILFSLGTALVVFLILTKVSGAIY